MVRQDGLGLADRADEVTRQPHQGNTQAGENRQQTHAGPRSRADQPGEGDHPADLANRDLRVQDLRVLHPHAGASELGGLPFIPLDKPGQGR